MKQDVEHTCRTCSLCQKCKKVHKKCGKLPAREVDSTPWERVNIDLIGPWSVKTPTKTHTLNALTIIDPATSWFEIIEVKDTTAATVAAAFDDAWLSRYPRPHYVGYDGDSENKCEFKQMIIDYGLEGKPTTAYNLQGNSILERLHLVISDMPRTFVTNKSKSYEDRVISSIRKSYLLLKVNANFYPIAVTKV